MSCFYYIAAITDGRLIVGITKFDTLYEADEPDVVTEEMLVQKTLQSIRDATGVSVPQKVVVPLCGKWALKDSKLTRQLMSSSESDEKPPNLFKDAVKALERYRVPIPAGQGQSQEEAVGSRFSPKELVKKLEQASGISSMKAR